MILCLGVPSWILQVRVVENLKEAIELYLGDEDAELSVKHPLITTVEVKQDLNLF